MFQNPVLLCFRQVNSSIHPCLRWQLQQVLVAITNPNSCLHSFEKGGKSFFLLLVENEGLRAHSPPSPPPFVGFCSTKEAAALKPRSTTEKEKEGRRLSLLSSNNGGGRPSVFSPSPSGAGGSADRWKEKGGVSLLILLQLTLPNPLFLFPLSLSARGNNYKGRLPLKGRCGIRQHLVRYKRSNASFETETAKDCN